MPEMGAVTAVLVDRRNGRTSRFRLQSERIIFIKFSSLRCRASILEFSQASNDNWPVGDGSLFAQSDSAVSRLSYLHELIYAPFYHIRVQ